MLQGRNKTNHSEHSTYWSLGDNELAPFVTQKAPSVILISVTPLKIRLGGTVLEIWKASNFPELSLTPKFLVCLNSKTPTILIFNGHLMSSDMSQGRESLDSLPGPLRIPRYFAPAFRAYCIWFCSKLVELWLIILCMWCPSLGMVMRCMHAICNCSSFICMTERYFLNYIFWLTWVHPDTFILPSTVWMHRPIAIYLRTCK